MTNANWNAAVLSSACVVLGAVFGVIVGGHLAPPVADDPWLNSYQGLIGSFFGFSAAALGLSRCYPERAAPNAHQSYEPRRRSHGT